MKRRLTLAILGTAAAALLLAGVGTLLLARIGARQSAEEELRNQAESTANLVDLSQTRSAALSADDTEAMRKIVCRDAAAALEDARHSVLFLRKLGPEGYGGGPAAYLLADRHRQNAPYQPATTRAWQSNGKRPTIDRTATGIYSVTLPG